VFLSLLKLKIIGRFRVSVVGLFKLLIVRAVRVGIIAFLAISIFVAVVLLRLVDFAILPVLIVIWAHTCILLS